MKKTLSLGQKLLFALPLACLALVGVAGMRQRSVSLPLSPSIKLADSHLATALQFSPDGGRLVVFFSDIKTPRLVRGQIYNTKSGAKLRNLQMPELSPSKGSSDSIESPVWSPDGKRLITPAHIQNPARMIQPILVWDAANGQLKSYFTSPMREFFELENLHFSPNGKRILGGGIPPAIFDAATGRRLNKPDASVESYGYSRLSENGQWLASVSQQNGTFRVRDYKTKKVLWQPKLNALTGFQWSGEILCLKHGAAKTGGLTQSRLLLWNAKTRRQLPSPPTRLDDRMYDVAFSPDGRTLVYFNDRLNYQSKTIKYPAKIAEAVAWDYEENRVLWRTEMAGNVLFPYWSPDGKWLLWLANTKRENTYRLTVVDKGGKLRFKRDSIGFATSWSSDSKQLAFTAVKTGQSSAKQLSSRIEIQRF